MQTATAVVEVIVPQLVRWKPLAAVGATGVQAATTVGPLTTVAAGQVVVVQLLPAEAAEGVQAATATLVVVIGAGQVVVV